MPAIDPALPQYYSPVRYGDRSEDDLEIPVAATVADPAMASPGLPMHLTIARSS